MNADKASMEIFRLDIDCQPKWLSIQQYFEKIGQELPARVVANLRPVCVINESLYIEYCGKKEHYKMVMDAYKKKRDIIEAKILSTYSVSFIGNGKKVDEMKLSWLKELISIYQPRQIKFNIFMD